MEPVIGAVLTRSINNVISKIWAYSRTIWLPTANRSMPGVWHFIPTQNAPSAIFHWTLEFFLIVVISLPETDDPVFHQIAIFKNSAIKRKRLFVGEKWSFDKFFSLFESTSYWQNETKEFYPKIWCSHPSGINGLASGLIACNFLPGIEKNKTDLRKTNRKGLDLLKKLDPIEKYHKQIERVNLRRSKVCAWYIQYCIKSRKHLEKRI